jgi:hypothetical protein
VNVKNDASQNPVALCNKEPNHSVAFEVVLNDIFCPICSSELFARSSTKEEETQFVASLDRNRRSPHK